MDSSSKIIIIDYGYGNLHSIEKALRFLGEEPIISASPTSLSNTKAIIIPGVGAFGDGMAGLRKNNLIKPIRKFASSGRPILGICLGMQLLLSTSKEFGLHQGLNIIPGQVVRLPAKPKNNSIYKIPHIGWNQLLLPNPDTSWNNTILASVQPREEAYFIHSYAAYPADPKHILAYTEHGGHLVPSVIKKNNIYGCQFHPEKSRAAGLSILKAFLSISNQNK